MRPSFSSSLMSLEFRRSVSTIGLVEALLFGELAAAGVAGFVAGGDGEADDVVSLAEVDALVAGGGTAHGAEVLLVEADGHAVVGGEEDDLLAVGGAGLDELVVLVDVDGDDAAGHDVGEVLEGGLLDGAVAGGEEDVLALFVEVADGEDGDDFFSGLEGDERGHGLALACGGDVGDLVDLEPVDAAGVGEAEKIGVGGVDDELGDEVFVAGLHAEAAGASAPLLAVDGDGRALEVAGVGDGDGDLLVGDEVFELELGGLVDDGGAAGVAVLVADLGELLDDDAAELGRGGEDGLVLGDVVADFGEFLEELVDGELGEAVELQFEDGVDLLVAEDQRAGGRERHVDVVLGGVEFDAGEFGAAEVDRFAAEVLEEALAGFGAAAGLADDLDDVVEVVERDLVAEEDVFAVAGLAEEEGGAAADDFDAVFEEGADGCVEREFLGLAVVDGQEDHGEGLLHLGVLVELVEDDLVLGSALEADDDAHAVAVGLVAELVAGDVGDDALVDEVGDALDELGLVDLVGDLGDDDGLAAAGDVFDAALGAHHEAATAGFVGLGMLSCRRCSRRWGSPGL